MRRGFEHATARVFPVTSGTAANALALSALCPPWGAVLAHETAHVLNSECASTSLLGGGAALQGLPGDDFRIAPAALEQALDGAGWGDPHHSQPSVLSLAQATDMGTIYTVEEIAALAAIARGRGLRVHLDGARVANARGGARVRARRPDVARGRRRADPRRDEERRPVGRGDRRVRPTRRRELVYRTKRAGHVTSKMRFQSAQLIAYLDEERWLRTEVDANARMARLAAGLADLGVGFVDRPQVNMLFAEVGDGGGHAARGGGPGLLPDPRPG